MAIEELTLIEIDLEDARIGPVFHRGGGEAPADDGDSGPGVGAGILVLLLAVGAALAARRLLGGRDGETEQITIEHAAEQ